ncbi:hypothetical protein HS125_03415 [bacterium]|nr:hypothetical protein [bacterium]
MSDTREFVHTIDARDVIVEVNDAWRQFACESDAGELPERALGAVLWDHISDFETVYLYQAMVRIVREQGRRLKADYRCDSPRLRRFLCMEIVAMPERAVRFVSRVVKIEEREAEPLLDAHAARADWLLKMCSWCRKVLVGENDWREVEEAVRLLGFFQREPLPAITHSMCPVCYERVMSQLR